MTATMTTKQRLVAHVEEMHGGFGTQQGDKFRGRPMRSWTERVLAQWHARQHHRYATNHYHAGVNTDAEHRPPGWWTGEDAVAKR